MPNIGIGLKTNLINSSGSSLRADTIAYKTRVEADGGEVVDINYVNNWYAALEAQSLDSETGFIGGPNMGVKKSGGAIETFYNLIDASNDATQSGGTEQATDGTDVNAGARVATGDGANDHYDFTTQIDIVAGDGLIMWWQLVDAGGVGGYWAGTTGSSSNGARLINSQASIRASSTFSTFSIPSADRPTVPVMRCTSIVRASTDQDTCFIQGVQISTAQTNANTFQCPNLFDGVNAHFSSSMGTMVLLESTVNSTQREALEAVGNAKNILPNNFLQSGEFCIVVVPDIQSDIDAGGAKSQLQANWIRDNATSQNIELVVYLGDQANDGTQTSEHELARDIIDTFLATVPTLWVFGNHDEDDNASSGSTRDTTNFDAEFPTTALSTQSWWDGGFEGSFSSAAYFLFSVSGTDYIAVTLPFGPTQDEIDWINTLIGTTYSSRIAILFTHSYIDEDGAMSGTGGNDADQYSLGADIHVGTEIKSEVSDLRSNLRLIFNGHHVGANGTHRFITTVSGENQNAVYANYQDQANDGDGYLLLVYINPTTETARVLSYSPSLDSFKDISTEYEHKFGLEL